jgi:hypothetical protein
MCTGDSKQNNVALTTRAKDYSPSKEKVDDLPPALVQPSPATPPTNGPLHLERPSLDTVLRPPPKGVIRKSAFNPHARAAQNYSIVEDLAQAPSTMSALEVLQSCPAQWKALLKAIGGIDPTDMNLIVFDLEDHIPRLPPQLAFQIQVVVSDKNICRTVIDEGASTCVMSLACWKAIGSPPLNESKNTLKAFNGSGFKPYGVLPSFPITLEGKTVQVEVEVFDAPLDYNLLLGRSWIDSMRVVVSTLFRVVRFPHQGKVVTVDQLAFFNSDTRTGNVPFIAKTPPGYENVGVGLLKDSSLMGTFPIPPPDVPRPSVASINMISTMPHELPASHDPWIVPDPGDHLRFGDAMPLSPVESAYQAIQSATPSTPSLDELSPDPFRVIFPTDKMIMSIMEDTPWDDGHHRSILFLEQHTLENYQRILTPSTVVVISTVPATTHDVFAEGNLSNISPTIPIDISIKPGIIENVHIGASCSPDEIVTYTSLFKEFHDIFAWSYEEMLGIDPAIVVHEIKTYPGAKPVWKRLHPVHPRKSVAIKLEVEKLLKASFIYPVALTEWVSNPIPIDKKGGSIRVCVDYRDINKACPKDNFPTPFVDQIVDDYAGSEIFSLMDGFSGYNQINIAPKDQHKTDFICPWGTFSYRKLPFGLKNINNFFHAMSYDIHGYIIVAIDYFMKWAEAMLTFDNARKTTTLFLFNHVIAHFGVPQAIITDHGSHFRNFMMSELTEKLGLRHDNSMPYYPQANGQVEAINKVLITMLRRMIGIHKTSWHTMLFSALWAYRTSVKSATGFTPFQLVYGVEAILPIECEIPSLKLVVELLPNTSAEEERLLYLMRLDETRHDATLVIEAQKKRVKAQYDKHVKPRIFLRR